MEYDDIKIIKEIGSKVFSANIFDIKNINKIQNGLNNKNYTFVYNEKIYVIRIPYENSKKSKNFISEHFILNELSKKDLTDKLIYFDEKNGIKITEYIANSHICDITSFDDIFKCIDYIKNFHKLEINTNYFHNINVFEIIDNFEKTANKSSFFNDYFKYKKMLSEKYKNLKIDKENIKPIHFDAHKDNFLITNDRIYLLDWEFVGMGDEDFDIVSFITYEYMHNEKVSNILKYYYNEDLSKEKIDKIHLYIAVMSLLWYAWANSVSNTNVNLDNFKSDMIKYINEYIVLL